MKELKIKKLPVLLPLVLLIAVLVVYTVLNFRGVSAAKSLTLGQQCLNDMNYSGAVSAFTQVIELDPNNVQARVGLAQAYVGTDEYDFAQQMLEQIVYTEQPNEEAADVMIQIKRDLGHLPQAMSLTQSMIDATDKDKYYDLWSELLAEIQNHPRSLAMGTDYTLCILDGQVYGSGSNAMGQLGLDPAAAPDADRMIPLNFSGTAKKIACAGRTSFVVDENGALWAAGENRWGQMGGGGADTVPQAGWSQVPCAGRVADAAGTTGRLLVLLEDGSVWTAGAGTGQSLQPLSAFPYVSAIAADEDQAVLLTTDGLLYSSASQTPESWTLTARGVCSFSLSNNALCWVDENNNVSASGSRFAIPDGWSSSNGQIHADRAVVRMVVLNGLTLFTSSNGTLYRIMDTGTLQEVPCDSPVSCLEAQGDFAVLEYQDGSAAYWSPDEISATPITT